MSLADVRTWARAAKADAARARILAHDLHDTEDERRAREIAGELEEAAQALQRSTRFALAALREGAPCRS